MISFARLIKPLGVQKIQPNTTSI